VAADPLHLSWLLVPAVLARSKKCRSHESSISARPKRTARDVQETMDPPSILIDVAARTRSRSTRLRIARSHRARNASQAPRSWRLDTCEVIKRKLRHISLQNPAAGICSAANRWGGCRDFVGNAKIIIEPSLHPLHLFANSVNAPTEMSFHCRDCDSSCACNFLYLHLLNKTHMEDGPLSVG
jgi:hypothetical protein